MTTDSTAGQRDPSTAEGIEVRDAQPHDAVPIGKALVSSLEAHARALGCSLIFLTSAEARDDAHAFYRRLGYDETGRRFAKRLAAE